MARILTDSKVAGAARNGAVVPSRGTPEAVGGLGYVPALDGVRGIAVAAVILGHAGIPFMRGGFLGVDVFFVLSGFLITRLLLDEWVTTGGIRLSQFYVRRALRLFPALLLLLDVYAVYFFFVRGYFLDGPQGPMWKPFAAALLYLGNWVRAYGLFSLDILDHTWSLGIEEQFYLLWPSALALLLARRASHGLVLGVTVSGIVGSLILRALLWAPGAGAARAYNGLDTRAEPLLIGALAALLLFYGGTGKAMLLRLVRLAWIPAVAVVLVAIATSTWNAKALYFGGGTLFAASVAVIVVALVTGTSVGLSRVIGCVGLVGVGKISYGLYLYHYPIFQSATLARLNISAPGKVLLATALTLLVAIVSFYVIERPALRLKERFRPMEHAS
jgi:peptidoglycan/LPS O-acetylase OafA/YrhL